VTFPGEAVRLYYAAQLSGGPDDDGVPVFYLGDGQSYAATAGDDWMAGFYAYDYIETPSEPVEAILVFETIGSGSGTIRVTYGMDPDYDLDPSFAVHDAGTHTVTVPGITAIPLPAFDLNAYWNFDAILAARVEVLSGSFTVDQVRLRLWPPGGPVGGWSSVVTPAVSDPTPFTYTRAMWLSEVTVADELDGAGAQIEARLEMESAVGTSSSFSPPVSGTLSGGTTYAWPAARFGSAGPYPFYNVDIRRTRVALGVGYTEAMPPGVEGVDWVRPPDQVATPFGTPTDVLGSPTFAWEQSVASIIARSGQFGHEEGAEDAYSYWNPFPFYLLGGPVGEWEAPEEEGGDEFYNATPPVVSYPFGTAPPVKFIDRLDLVDYPLGDGDDTLAITLFHQGEFVAQEYVVESVAGVEVESTGYTDMIFVGGDIAGMVGVPLADEAAIAYEPLTYRFTPPPFRYWSPTAVALSKLRQYHRDDGRGVAPRRAYGGASRVHTGRAYGYT
jgi:hypothetical protein